MASNLRVDNIQPSTGMGIGIGTANGSVTFNADVTGGLNVSTGSVGLGTNIPSTTLDVEGSNVPVAINSSNSNTYKIQLENANTTVAYIGAATSEIYFANADVVEQARFTDNGLRFPSGKGIDFSATSDGSGMTSELLDDYEEGTWTPTINASLTGGVRAGFYTKVGNKVTAWAIVQWTANSGAGGGIGIGGLPYSSTSESYFRGPGSVGYTSGVDLGASIAQLVVHLNPSTTNISLHTLADNAAASAIGAQNCSASGEIQVTMTYMV